MNESEGLYGLELHAFIKSSGFYITRVPGGWIYETYADGNGWCDIVTSVFVPFNNEFQNKKG